MNYIFGDSHLRSLGRLTARNPLDATIIHNHGKNFIDMDVDTGADSVRVFSDKVDGFAAVDLTVMRDDVLVLSGPLHSSLVTRHPMWRSHVHWSLAKKQPNRKVVSNNFFDQVAQSRLRSMMQFLNGAKAIGVRVAVLEPPFLSRRAIVFSKLSAVTLATNDQAYRESVCRLLNDAGIGIIRTPAQTHDGQFLRPEFEAKSERDVHHGNDAYANLTLPDIIAFIESGHITPFVPEQPKLARRLLGLK